MITLSETNTIQGVAASASVISYMITGCELNGTTETYKILAQGQLPNSAGVLYEAPASTTAFAKNITLVNTSAADVTGIILYVNGSTSPYQIIPSSVIVANGKAVFDGTGWKFYDADGALLVANSTRDIDGLILAKQEQIGFVGNAFGGLLTTGLVVSRVVPFGYTIRKWKVTCQTASSIVIDVKKNGVSLIGAGNKPTLVSSQIAEANCTGWTTVTGSAYDQLDFYINSTTAGNVILTLYLTKV